VKKREGGQRYPVDSVSSDERLGIGFHCLLTLLDGREKRADCQSCVISAASGPARPVTLF
jgi:hypothetical protein